MDSNGREPEPTTDQPRAVGDDSPDDRQQQFTRARVAEVLDVSVTTIRRLEGRTLHPHRGQDGIHLFDRTEVEHLAATRRSDRRQSHRDTQAGQISAAAFALLKNGTRPSDVVIELELPARVVEDLHESWERLNNRHVIENKVLEQLRRAVVYGVLDIEFLEGIEKNDYAAILNHTSEKRLTRTKAIWA